MKRVSGTQGRPVQALGSGHVDVSLVNRRHFELWRELSEYLVDLLRVLAVAFGVAIDKDSLRALLRGSPQRHCGMHSELARLVRRSGNNAAFPTLSANHDGLALQRRIKELFHRDEEGVHVDVEDDFGQRAHAQSV